MGTSFAVSAAVFYMAQLEDPLLLTINQLFYRRFIHILFIWSGDLPELLSFLNRLNNLAPTIKLTWNISQRDVIFLDMVVRVDQDINSAISKTSESLPVYSIQLLPS